MIKKTAAVVLMVLWGVGAHADLLTDRAAFSAETHTVYTEGFESLSSSPVTGTVSFSSGLTVSSPVMPIAGVDPSAVGNTSRALYEGVGFGPQRGGMMFPIELHLGGLYSSFGADFFQNYGNGEQTFDFLYTLDLFNNGNQIASSGLVSAAPNTGSFIGFTSSNCTLPWNNQLCTFDTVRISAGVGYAMLDNVTVGNVSAVPEPQTYGLLLAGLSLMAIVARRRTRRHGV